MFMTFSIIVLFSFRPIPSIPAPASLPANKSMRPYTTYELDNIRQQAKRYVNITNAQNEQKTTGLGLLLKDIQNSMSPTAFLILIFLSLTTVVSYISNILIPIFSPIKVRMSADR